MLGAGVCVTKIVLRGQVERDDRRMHGMHGCVWKVMIAGCTACMDVCGRYDRRMHGMHGCVWKV